MQGEIGMFDKYITLLTFIPWCLFFIISVIRNLNNKEYRKFSLKYLKNNFFNIFRLDLLFLILVFFYFASFEKDFVDKYLFMVMNLYLCVNSIYEKKKRITQDFFKNNIIELILLLIIMLLPFSFYFIKNNLVLTYKIMLIYLILEYIIILIVSYIGNLLKGKKS